MSSFEEDNEWTNIKYDITHSPNIDPTSKTEIRPQRAERDPTPGNKNQTPENSDPIPKTGIAKGNPIPRGDLIRQHGADRLYEADQMKGADPLQGADQLQGAEPLQGADQLQGAEPLQGAEEQQVQGGGRE
nr:uncharacterized protein LOC123773102 [Procambarus clarkii]